MELKGEAGDGGCVAGDRWKNPYGIERYNFTDVLSRAYNHAPKNPYGIESVQPRHVRYTTSNTKNPYGIERQVVGMRTMYSLRGYA